MGKTVDFDYVISIDRDIWLKAREGDTECYKSILKEACAKTIENIQKSMVDEIEVINEAKARVFHPDTLNGADYSQALAILNNSR